MHNDVCVEYNEPTKDQSTSDRENKLQCLAPKEHLYRGGKGRGVWGVTSDGYMSTDCI